MKKVYIDRTESDECVALFANDAEIIGAGTTVYSMPQSDFNEEYKRFAAEYDINFIFDNSHVQIDFYAVPQFDIMATDSEGGYIGTIGGASDLESDYRIGYIDKDKNCFLIASSGKEFIENAANWKDCKQKFDEIRVYDSKEEAQRKLDFIDVPKLDAGKLLQEIK